MSEKLTKKYKKGAKFKVCTCKYLTDVLGWWVDDSQYYHDDYKMSMSFKMMTEWEGKTLTIHNELKWLENWYNVDENNYLWPVATLLSVGCLKGCEEGITPIDGWIICKNCGTDLRTVK